MEGNREMIKYKAQNEYKKRHNLVKCGVDIEYEIREKFKEKCKENKTKMTQELKKFIKEYIKEKEG